MIDYLFALAIIRMEILERVVYVEISALPGLRKEHWNTILRHLPLMVVFYRTHMGVSTNGGTPIAGWFTRENPI